MRTSFLLALAIGCASSPRPSPSPSSVAVEASAPRQDFAELKARAEQLHAEGSYALARDAYAQALPLAKEPDDVRWVRFRIADADWRALASSERSDPSQLEAAQRALEALVRDVRREDEKDRIYAEVQESLGDFFWTRRDAQDWGRAWPAYQAALEWWAGSSELDLARSRYLAVAWKTVTPAGLSGWERGWWIQTPDEVIENALSIAESLGDRARAHVLRAATLQNRGGDWRTLARIPREYEAALEGGKDQPWYDDALFGYAQWMESSGRVVRGEGGALRQEPDFVRARELYLRLTEEFRKGESRWWDEAKQGAERIVQPELSLRADRIFLPGSLVGVQLSWRNVRSIELALHPFDVLRDVRPRGDDGSQEWLAFVDVGGREPLARWTRETGDDGQHRPGNAEMQIDRELGPGAYLLTATGGGKSARELVMVSETSLVLEAVGSKALTWVTTAELGRPIAEAQVVVLEQVHDGDRWPWRRFDGSTGADGIARFELSGRPTNRHLLALAKSGERVAFAQLHASWSAPESGQWRVQAVTDRPAYRPEDTVRWKILARRFDGSRYSTPAGAKLGFKLMDPRGAEVKSGVLALNAFGSAWGELALDAGMALGEYQLVLYHGRTDANWIGQATLFRLEEYKLPEFEVSVELPRDGERRRTFRSGDEVEAIVSAQYYAGGAVANATVQVLLYQRPLWIHRPTPREFPWFYASEEHWNPWRWSGESLVTQWTLTTGGDGRASFKFPTPLEAQNDFQYRIEARVTDASRREVVGSGMVRVARQSYYVFPRARHNVHRPGERVEIDFDVADANGQPVEAEGVATVWRLRWYRIWRDARGRELGEEEYRALAGARASPAFLVAREGYERDQVLTRPLRAGADGKATLAFTPEREGCYQVEWESRDVDGAPIRAEASVWVASDDTRDLSWRRGEIEIVLDRDTLRAGEDALVLLSSASGPCAVLFTVESEDIHSAQVVEITGSVKLMRVRLDERHVPNVFLRATTVRGGEAWVDQEEVIVPPLAQFLDVQVEPERPEVKPGEECGWRITTRGRDGEPVPSEVAFAVIDESVLSIQGDYAADPRQFFYGQKRQLSVAWSSTSQQRRFARLVLGKDGKLADERGAGREAEESGRRLDGFQEMDMLGAKSARSERASDAAPAAPGAAREGRQAGDELGSFEQVNAAAGGAIVVRSDFRATAFWQPDVATGEDGVARVRARMPQSLSRWRASARAATAESRFGIGHGSTRTNLPLTARLQAPRFFVAGDTCTISALLDNHTGEPLEVSAALLRDGELVAGPMDEALARTVPAGGQARLDWRLRFERPGAVKLQVRARSGELADAMEKGFFVYEHGLDQLVAKSGKLPGGSGAIRIEIPADRRPGSTSLVVTVGPSLAVTMLDALPYLIDYPYGCVEQTMSRFLPAAIVARTLRELGLDPEAAMARVFGGVEGEYAAKTHPQGKKSLELLGDVTSDALKRLYDMQHEGGGWGWWKGGGSDRFMTAYVVWGLALARESGLEVRADAAQRGAEWLERELVEAEEEPDLAAWMLHALAAHARAHDRKGPGELASKALDRLWTQRDRLNACTRALFALAAHGFRQADRARTLVDNLVNGVSIDRSPDTSIVQRGAQASDPRVLATAHWGRDGIAWRWSDGAVESTATVLRALLAIRPDHELVSPTVTWLVKNRRGAQWSSTRDTAIAVLALGQYLKTSGEAEAEVAFDLKVNGRKVASSSVARGQALSAPARFAVDPALVQGGANEIEIERTAGDAPLYFAIEARFFSREEPVRAAGNEVFVRREYFALVPRRTLLKGYVHDRVPLASGAPVESGTRIETVLTLEAKNDLEYMILEDLKPAGLEAVDVRSGGEIFARELRADALGARMDGRRPAGEDSTGRTIWTHRELRDRKVALFLAKIPQGTWQLAYEMRAEVPGDFHALPLVAQAMYVPEIRGNDVETSFVVR